MRRLTKLTLAAAMPIAVSAGVGAAAPAAAGAPDAATPEPTVPANWVALTDDLGVLSISVPPEWVQVDTVPDVNDDGSPRPWIAAASDYQTFRDTFDAPGVIYTAFPYTANPQELLDRFGLTGGCASQESVPYDDGAFSGVIGHWTACGTTAAPSWHMLAANIPGNTVYTYALQVQILSDAERPVLDALLSSFNVTGAPVAPATAAPTTAPATPTLPPAPPTTTAAPPRTTPAPQTAPPPVTGGPATTAAPAPGGFHRIEDDTSFLAVAVPDEWTATNTAQRTVDGNSQATIVASTDIALFIPASGETDTFAVPGLIYSAYPYSDADELLTLRSMGASCADAGREPYQDAVFVGRLQRWTGCGGTATRIITVAASPADRSFTAYLLVQLTSPDDAPLQTILGTFDYTRGTGA